MVHHQQTRRVALSSRKDRAGGGGEYIDMAATPVYLRRGDERGDDGIRRSRSGGSSIAGIRIPSQSFTMITGHDDFEE